MSFADEAPYRVDAVVDCPTSAGVVYEVFKDNRGGVQWLGWFVTKVEPTSDPEHGVGATREVTFLWGLGKLKERFIGWEEPHLWSFTSVGFRPKVFTAFVERVRFETVDDNNCRIVYRMGADVARLYRPLAPLLMRFLNRAIVPTLEGARDLAVTRATSAAGDQ
ncbi:hypothetical protein BKG68_04345 [Mycobacteroides saopaulense]|uniref:Polyketide cyclase n=2 Tax=Mycobacteroides saopaulense TaxID=1578165 RepID=A0ABX3C5R3_9MYCO|nr:hypothetical protein BKG68_04345 [Mycobacteroides saopaulense]OHU13904.1 hypothetical protein BKG73_04355 [Mycobacteroides saopaulense]